MAIVSSSQGGSGAGANVSSTFGDAVGVTLNPLVSLKAVYGLINDVEVFEATGGSVTATNSEFVCQSGTSVGGYGTVWSRKPIVYQPGVGCEARFTARFTTGIALSTQLAGLFSSVDGMFFGYDGADFGVMHRYGGEFEIREYTVTAAATGATIAVELNGTTYNVAIAASATVQEAAHDIEVALQASSANDAWHIQHIDDKIVFQFRGVGAKSGNYSITGDATLAGSFTQVKAGADPTEDWTAMSSWNRSQPDWLDVTKGNLYRVEFAYLGYGPLNYYIMNPSTKKWQLVHQVDWPNKNTVPNFGNPSLRVGWASASLGSSGTNLTVAGASAMAALQGKSNAPDRSFAAVGSNTGVTTETQVLSVEVRREFNGRSCNVVVLPSLSVATDGQKGMIFRVYLNPDIAGDTVETYIDEDQSVCLYDTAGTTVSGGTLIDAFVVGPNGGKSISSDELGAVLVAGDILCVTAQVTTGASAGAYVTINTKELL